MPRFDSDRAMQVSSSPDTPLRLVGANSAVTASQCVAELPGFLKPPPASMDPEDLEYLARKGSLTLPDPDLRDACLRSYFQYVQPCFPVVDVKAFHGFLHAPGPKSDKFSLLVFQSMMFVGSIWVDIRLIRRLGFLTRHSARRAMHSKVRSLYDSDYEDDRTCLLQSLILLTFWWESPNENKDAWHWIGTALSVSRTLGLHQPCSDEIVSPGVARFRKRLWWTLLMRDTISSFGLSRAPRIRDEDHFVAMLEMEDFDLDVPGLNSMPGIVSSSVAQQELFGRLCIELSKLCRILRKILQLAYPESASGQTASLYSTRQLNGMNKMTLPRKAPDMEQLKLCDEDLSRWRERVPEEVLHASPLPDKPEEFDQAELAHRALITMLYFTALLTLHRPRILKSSSVQINNHSPPQVDQDKSRSIVRYAATEITRIGMDFYEADLVKSLSATCIGCFLPAGISHIFDANSADDIVQADGLQMFNQCRRILQDFSDAHKAADWCINILDTVSTQVRKQKLARNDSSAQDTEQLTQLSQPKGRDITELGTLSSETAGTLSQNTVGDGVLPNKDNDCEAHQMYDVPAAPQVPFPSHTSYQAVDNFGQMPMFESMAAASVQAPLHEYTNTIGPGEMWLDIAGMASTSAETDWTGNDAFWLSW
ncbi:hypothetical protein LTR84_009525 [Exophiala bonariae]|uniref:Xylanolytic transcriptional activator regulatory domain-containing protein n=1 Tax=Exophiala bonariae TaxID=1690606 RepID=A0AAV9MU95_9EURO|nr:hypothetical protein LTR84_009525 [Exophiala bonariae]